MAEFAALETRLQSLEAGVGSVKPKSNLASDVARIQNDLASLRSPEVLELFKREKQAQQLLNDSDRSMLSTFSKAEIVHSLETQLLRAAELLRETEELRGFVDRVDFVGIEQQRKHVEPLQLVHLDQKIAGDNLISQGQALMENYNQNVIVLSELFIRWDRLLTDLEAQVDALINAH